MESGILSRSLRNYRSEDIATCDDKTDAAISISVNKSLTNPSATGCASQSLRRRQHIMDSQSCFTQPIGSNQILTNPVLSSLPRNFPRYMQPYDLHYTSDDKEEKDLYQALNHSGANIRYQPAIRKNNEFQSNGVTDTTNNNNITSTADSCGAPTPHNANIAEPSDLSVRSTSGETQSQQVGPNNTRLLREILQSHKQDDHEESGCNGDENLEDDDNISNDGSTFYEESEGETGGKSDDGKGYQFGDDAGVRVTAHDTGNNGEDESLQVKKARVENIVSSIRAPSNGTSSSENSGPVDENRKTKRKQVYPQHQTENGNAVSNSKEDVWRTQLDMMQRQIDGMERRYNQSSERGHGLKRCHDGDLYVSPGSKERIQRLTNLILAEIKPIISSYVTKYLRKEDTPSAKPKSRTPTPTLDPLLTPVLANNAQIAKNPEKPKQQLTISNDAVHAGKQFGNLYMGFPHRPFFGNENKVGNDFFSMQQFAAAAMAGAAPTMYNPHFQHLLRPGYYPEQTEAIPLVVPQKRKRHKVTDTRITPRVMNKIMNQKDDSPDNRKFLQPSPSPVSSLMGFGPNGHHFLARSLSARDSLQNSLNHSETSPFHPSLMDQSRHLLPSSNFYTHAGMDRREIQSPANASGGSPSNDVHDQNSMDFTDSEADEVSGSGRQPNIPYSSRADSLTYSHSSTLSPMHLRKAKLMFFYTRYPNSATLKTFFPDIKFNKNNTAQLVKWFSNFREFYYIQMEKYARAALAEGLQTADEIQVAKDSELYKALNLHYNRNNHIEVPDSFRGVVEESLKEFFRAIQVGRDQEPSWKKAIYKVINRLDDPIPDYFKSPHFLEQLE